MKTLKILSALVSVAYVCSLVSCNPEGIKPTPGNYIINGPQDVDPAFSPDGNFIAYAHLYDTAKNYPQGLYIIDKNGNNRKLVLAGFHFGPNWSPDGEWLVVTSGGKVQKCKTDGSQLIPFTGLNTLDYPEFYYPKWSSDGKLIMFYKPLGAGISSLYGTSSDFKRYGVLFGLNIPTGSYPSLSPSRKNLVYIKGSQSFQAGTEVFLTDTLGLNDLRLTTNNREDKSPTWSPGGDRIIWSSGLRLTIMNSNGSNQIEIGFGNNPSWSINDEIVFSHANADYSKEVIYIISTDGKNKKQITQ